MYDINSQPILAFNDREPNLDSTNFEPFNYSHIREIFDLDELNPGDIVEKYIYISHNSSRSLSNVGFFINNFVGDYPAKLEFSNVGPFVFNNDNNLLSIKLNDSSIIYDISLPTGYSLTKQDVVEFINEYTESNVCFINENGKIELISNISGFISEIYILQTSNCLDVLGISDKHNLVSVSSGGKNDWGYINDINRRTEFSNDSLITDMNDILLWGDYEYGLDIGMDGNMHKFSTGYGDDIDNVILMDWGEVDGSTILPYNLENSEGLISTKLSLSIPDNIQRLKTGFRQFSLGVSYRFN